MPPRSSICARSIQYFNSLLLADLSFGFWHQRSAFVTYAEHNESILSIDPGLDGRRSTYQRHWVVFVFLAYHFEVSQLVIVLSYWAGIYSENYGWQRIRGDDYFNTSSRSYRQLEAIYNVPKSFVWCLELVDFVLARSSLAASLHENTLPMATCTIFEICMLSDRGVKGPYPWYLLVFLSQRLGVANIFQPHRLGGVLGNWGVILRASSILSPIMQGTLQHTELGHNNHKSGI
jgi:hypothetical protein